MSRADDAEPSIGWRTLTAVSAASLLLPPLMALLSVRCLGWHKPGQARARTPASAALSRFVPFNELPDDGLAVDCTHPRADSLTHHRGSKTPPSLRGDASTDTVLNAAKARHLWLSRTTSCNHFDMDGLLSVFTVLYPKEALQYEALLRAAARLGDFRDQGPAGDTASAALLLNAWVNAVEKSLFSAPFRGTESHESSRKYDYFLPRVGAAIALADACAGDEACLPASCVLREHAHEVDAELLRIRIDSAALSTESVVQHPAIGLAVVSAPRPLHYYALFSACAASDTVLTVYPGNRYELEHRYTGFVHFASRVCVPRISLDRLAKALDKEEKGEAVAWVANSITDSGPMLRLEHSATHASKADRYAHPYEREILASSIPPARMVALVRSYLEHALRGVAPRKEWSWTELHELNSAVDWDSWVLPEVKSP